MPSKRRSVAKESGNFLDNIGSLECSCQEKYKDYRVCLTQILEIWILLKSIPRIQLKSAFKWGRSSKIEKPNVLPGISDLLIELHKLGHVIG